MKKSLSKLCDGNSLSLALFVRSMLKPYVQIHDSSIVIYHIFTFYTV